MKEVFELLRDELAAVETEFERGTVSTVPAITDIGAYLRAGGGKRFKIGAPYRKRRQQQCFRGRRRRIEFCARPGGVPPE